MAAVASSSSQDGVMAIHDLNKPALKPKASSKEDAKDASISAERKMTDKGKKRDAEVEEGGSGAGVSAKKSKHAPADDFVTYEDGSLLLHQEGCDWERIARDAYSSDDIAEILGIDDANGREPKEVSKWPKASLGFIGLLAQESDETVVQLARRIQAVIFRHARSGGNASEQEEYLSESCLINAIDRISVRTNYGLAAEDITAVSSKWGHRPLVPAALQLWRWEIKRTTSLSAEVEAQLLARREERESKAKAQALELFLGLSPREQDTLLLGRKKALAIHGPEKPAQEKSSSASKSAQKSGSSKSATPRGKSPAQAAAIEVVNLASSDTGDDSADVSMRDADNEADASVAADTIADVSATVDLTMDGADSADASQATTSKHSHVGGDDSARPSPNGKPPGHAGDAADASTSDARRKSDTRASPKLSKVERALKRDAEAAAKAKAKEERQKAKEEREKAKEERQKAKEEKAKAQEETQAEREEKEREKEEKRAAAQKRREEKAEEERIKAEKRAERQAIKAEKQKIEDAKQAEKQAEQDKKQKVIAKSASFLTSFLKKQSPSTKAPETPKEDEAPKSDFDRVFLPCIIKNLAPINRFDRDIGRDIAAEVASDDAEPSKLLADFHSKLSLPLQQRRDRLAIRPRRGFQPDTSVREVMHLVRESDVLGDAAAEKARKGLARMRSRRRVPLKLLQFHSDRRPGWYGTWTRATKIIGPRTPFGQDSVQMDYSLDSDAEWEDEAGIEGDDLMIVDDDEEEEAEMTCSDDDSEMDDWLEDDMHIEEPLEDDEDDEVIAVEDLGSPAPKRGKNASLPTDRKSAFKAAASKTKLSWGGGRAKKGRKKKLRQLGKRFDSKLIPFAAGPHWETQIGVAVYDGFQAYQVEFLNDAFPGLNPFTYQPPVRQAPVAVTETADPALPTSMASAATGATPGKPLEVASTEDSAKKPGRGRPKASFPEAHTADFCRALVAAKESFKKSRPLLVTDLHDTLSSQFGKGITKKAIEMKLDEVADKPATKGAPYQLKAEFQRLVDSAPSASLS